MSNAPSMRRAEKLMTEEAIMQCLAEGYCGRLSTVSADGYPYCVPLLYIWMNGKIFVHGTAAKGHLRTNIEANSKACFELDVPGQVFNYGRFECDVSISYRSVIAFGTIEVVPEQELKQLFCEQLMAKYGTPDSGRPKGFFPRLNQINVYALSIERLTGKEQILPPLAQQWPSIDRTATPDARP